MILKVIVLSLTISSFSLSAQAIPHEDCKAKFRTQFAKGSESVDLVQKLKLGEALDIASSEGLLEGRALRSAQLELMRAKQIYSVHLSNFGGSAVDLVTTERTCDQIRRVIRVQED